MSELNKVETYFEKNLKKLLSDGYVDGNVRAHYSNGDEATSTFITQIVEEYDIEKNEFPITEARYIGWKSGIEEMLAIYQSQTNTQEGFEKHGINWWKPWINSEGNIGRAYSHNLESHRPNEMRKNAVKIKKRILTSDCWEIEDIENLNPIKESIDGKVYETEYRDYGKYIITKKYRKKDKNQVERDYVDVQFLNNGYCSTLRYDSLQRGQHPKNNFIRTMLGVGYVGDFDKSKYEKSYVDKIRKIWKRMLHRCYDGNREVYDDIYVDKRWHCFATFIEDIKNLPQYHLAKENNFKGYHLDKDYYGSNCYSPETCVFLDTKENTTYRSTQVKPIKVNDVHGEYIVYLSKKDIAVKYRIGESTVNRWVRNGISSDGTLTFEEIDVEDGYLYRYELSRNQINELLRELKENKFSRRHMTSFFNWSNHNKKMLVECAYETLWTTYERGNDTYLDLTLIQRSSDVATANHINKIQYVAFMMMVAKHCGYEVGKFVHFVQNYHIYNSHLENVKELLSRIHQLKERETQSQPKLVLNVPDGTNFYDINSSDFELIDYNPIKPQLKFDLAI